MTFLSEQYAAWSFYGLPASASTLTPVSNYRARPVGEVSYVLGWIANQLSRLDWRVLVDGSDTWTITTEDGTKIRSDGSQPRVDSKNHPVRASATALSLIGWCEQQVKLLAINLFVAGECDYALTKRGTKATKTKAATSDCWSVISVIKPKRKEILEAASLSVHALWPHPADPDAPDAPLFAALPILSQLDWLTRLSEAQSSTRVGMRGVAGIADDMATQSGRDFWEELNDATQANMSDPENLAPVVIRGPAERVRPAGNGMEGFSWLVPTFPYDDKIEERIKQAIQRLAYSLPIPPEVLLGLQAQSRATAFQVEDSAYRAHIEPPADLLGKVAADALNLLLPDQQITIEVDPTRLLARLHTVQDVLDAFDRGAVSLPYLRTVLGIPDHAAPTEEDLAILYALNRVTRSDAEGTPDPAASASADPAPSQLRALVASLSPQAQTLVQEAPEHASRIADALYLSGVTQQVTDRARERVGAKARTHECLRAQLASEVPNSKVAAALGLAALRPYIDPETIVRHTVTASAAQCPDLVEVLCDHVLNTLEGEDSLPLPDEVILRPRHQ